MGTDDAVGDHSRLTVNVAYAQPRSSRSVHSRTQSQNKLYVHTTQNRIEFCHRYIIGMIGGIANNFLITNNIDAHKGQ